jgi:prepilin-type N-terminal cleavage/methylation domain-containing protein
MFKGRYTRRSTPIGNKGFTLIEILITMAILAVGILGVMTMQIRAVRSNAEARHVTESAAWVADQFERLIPMDYNHADLDPAPPGAPVTPNTLVNNNNDPYTVTYTVSNPDTPIPNVKTIDVTVTWNDGRPRILTFRYYKQDLF